MDNTRSHLKSFFTEHWKYMAVASAAKVGLFDYLGARLLSCKELAEALKLNTMALQFLLSALCNSGFLTEHNEKYQLAELSELLTEHHPDTLKYACLNWFGEHMTAWQYLPQTLENGRSYFENTFGIGYFDYLSKSPEKMHHYHLAMYEYAKDDYKELPQLIDWLQHKSVMDVGGGYGACIESIKKHHPQLDCHLFDLPEVAAAARQIDVNIIGGNFFDTIPKVADCIILSRVIHDWHDKNATVILKNCYNALPESGTLYLIENCKDLIETELSLLSLNMLVMCESHERTTTEYRAICGDAGLHFEGSVKLNALQHILIFKK